MRLHVVHRAVNGVEDPHAAREGINGVSFLPQQGQAGCLFQASSNLLLDCPVDRRHQVVTIRLRVNRKVTRRIKRDRHADANDVDGNLRQLIDTQFTTHASSCAALNSRSARRLRSSKNATKTRQIRPTIAETTRTVTVEPQKIEATVDDDQDGVCLEGFDKPPAPLLCQRQRRRWRHA